MSAAQWLALLAVLDTHPNCPPAIKAAAEHEWRQARADQPPPPTDTEEES